MISLELASIQAKNGERGVIISAHLGDYSDAIEAAAA